MRKHLLFFLLAFLPIVAMQAQTTYYNLTICGKQVTSQNANNILGDYSKSFVYDASTKTLTVKGDQSVENGTIINNGIDGLTLNVARDVTFQSTSTFHMVYNQTDCSMTVKGNGKLTMSNSNGTSGCFYVQGNATLTIDNMNIDGEGQNVFWGGKTTEKLVLKNSTIHAKCTGGGFGAIFELGGGITFEGCHIALPLGAYVDMTTFMGIVQSNGQIARDVTIEPGEGVEYYPLLICGQYVNADNADDVLGDGVFSYDASKKTLTIHGECIYDAADLIKNEGVEDLIINTTSDSQLLGTGTIVSVSANTIFTGAGNLFLQTDGTAIVVYKANRSVTFNKANVDIDGYKAFLNTNSTGQLTFKYSYVHAETTANAFLCYGGINFEDCDITLPEGGKVQNYKIVDSEGNEATEVTIVPKKYGLKICGKNVTGYNADDVLGDGVFSYNPETQTLTVSGDCTYNDGYIINSRIDGLVIDIATDLELKTEGDRQDIMYLLSNTTLTGDGKLTIHSEWGVFASFASFILKDINIEIYSKIESFYSTGQLTIHNSNLYAQSVDSPVFSCMLGSIVLESCRITQPEGGYTDGHTIYDSEGNRALEVTIEPVVETYDLWICGVDVTSRNADDVLGDGAFNYDAENKVLTVSGDIHYYSESGVISNIEDLTVNVTQDVTMSTGYATIIFYKNATLTGVGTLTLHSDTDCGIYIYKATLTIDNMTIDADGKWGFAGYPYNEYLIVRKSNIHAKGTEAAFCDFSSITLEGCSVTLPEGGYVDGGNIVDSEGNVAKEATISTGAVAIEGLAADSNKSTARYNLAGQRVGRDYKGIVIEGGKKTLVK